MRQQILAWVSGWLAQRLNEAQRHLLHLRTKPLWQNGVARVTGTLGRVNKRWMMVGLLILILGLLIVGRSAVSNAATSADGGLVTEEMAVLCIGVVRYDNGVQAAFFQRPGEPLDAVLGNESAGQHYTVEHRNCYASWQAAADFLTDGQVTLPDAATEQDFVTALMGWKQRQMRSGQ